MKSLLIAVVSIVLIQSCRHQQDLTETEKKRISEEIMKTLHRYHDEISKAGLTAEFKYLDHSPDFFWVPPGFGSPISYDSVEQILRRSAPAFTTVNNSFVTLKVFPLSETYATYTGTIQSHMADTMGIKSNTTLLETGVMIRRPDGWKLHQGHTSMLKQ